MRDWLDFIGKWFIIIWLVMMGLVFFYGSYAEVFSKQHAPNYKGTAASQKNG